MGRAVDELSSSRELIQPARSCNERASRRSEPAHPMAEVVIVIHLLVVIALVAVVLVQKSEGGGLGVGGGDNFMSARGSANPLSRATTILATIFFITSLTLAVLSQQNRAPRSILDNMPTSGQPSAPGAPTAPALPGQGGGILDQLQQLRQQPAAPAQPAQ